MDIDRIKIVKKTLQQVEVHNTWARGYRTADNDAFYILSFDYISTIFGDANEFEILDAGCGSGTKTLHLAKRGYFVRGVDISKKMLDTAKRDFENKPWRKKAKFELQDLTSMSFGNSSFEKVLCWGVLMHVPEIEKAVAELVRVTRSGGIIVVSEGNAWSLQAMAIRLIKWVTGRQRAEVIRTETGIELWEETSTGKLVTRQTDMKWLAQEFKKHGALLEERRAGQFTEIFTHLPWRPMRLLVHAFNNFYFRYIKIPGFAFGNILVFRKKN